ncbi:MAG: hypothetical protein J4A00_05975 [Gammaproteobacteria bacterium]|nr:hypothetical protein [Gammaproteobacteria bacterium]
MTHLRIFAAGLILTGLLGGTQPAQALQLTGTVLDAQGQPLEGVMIRVESSSAAAGVTKVFSGKNGRFLVPDMGPNVHVNSLRVSAHKLGYAQQKPDSNVLTQLVDEVIENQARVDFSLAETDNVAAQVGGSAWVNLAPPTLERHRTVHVCSQCHQVPDRRMKRFAEGLAGLEPAQKEAAWRAIISYMRVAFYGLIQAEHAEVDVPLEYLTNPANSFIDQGDEDAIAGWLTQHMPESFSHYPASSTDQFTARNGTSPRTVIREYAWPEASFVRETAVSNGQVWGVDINRNRIGQLDPEDGGYRWYDVPVIGPSAPHTMVTDQDGGLWVTLLGGGGEGAARLDPKTNRWTIYRGFEAGYSAHDFAVNHDNQILFDNNDMSWMTIVNLNKLVGFKRNGSHVESYDLPMEDGDNPLHVGVYGAIMSPDKNVWFSQNGGILGRFNTTSKKVDVEIPFPVGTGLHRMTIDDNGILYMGLQGAGQVYVYDTVNMQEKERLDLPDRAASPYAVAWDRTRNALWMGTVNNDALLRYDLATRAFTEIPLGIEDLHMRMIAVDYDSGDLWITNSPLPADTPEMRKIFQVHPGDA